MDDPALFPPRQRKKVAEESAASPKELTVAETRERAHRIITDDLKTDADYSSRADYSSFGRRRDEIMAKAKARMSNIKLNQALQTWLHITRTVRRERQVMSKASAFWGNPLLAKAAALLRTWQETARKMAAQQKTLQRGVARFDPATRKLASAFLLYRERAQEERRLRQLLRRAGMRIKSDLLRKFSDGFKKWRKCARADRIATRLLEKQRKKEAEQAAALARQRHKTQSGAPRQLKLQGPLVRGAWSDRWCAGGPKNQKNQPFGVYCKASPQLTSSSY